MAGYYDDESFFEAYGKMPRSSGLQYAGEWHQFRDMIPDPSGKDVLDLGCGMGWHSRCLAERGAKSVLGIDISEKMLEKASEVNASDGVSYRLCSIEAFEYPEDSYDLVLSNLSLHYVKDLEDVYRKVYRTLRTGGTFLFNIEHPSFTAGVGQQWICDSEGNCLYWPVDDYYYPGPRKTDFLGFETEKQHHTLTQIIRPLLSMGFTLTDLQEAVPSDEMMDLPGMKDEMRRPMMLLVRAEKV